MHPSFFAPTATRSRHFFWIMLLLIAVAELVTTVIQAQMGLVFHAVLLTGLLLYSGMTRRVNDGNFALALTLAPLLRILSLVLPLPHIPQALWYPAVASLLLISLWLIGRYAGVSRQNIGLTPGNVPLQATLALTGFGLGAIEYLILRPTSGLHATSLVSLVLLALNFVVFTGLVEELMFRGVLQYLAPIVLGRSGMLYVSLLFGVLHIGWLSFSDVVFVTLVGLLFAHIVRWSGSILGVTLAHGTTNITLFILMPSVAHTPSGEFELTVLALVFGSAIVIMMVCSVLATQATAAAQPRPVPCEALRQLRRNAQLSYVDLAQRLDMPVRRLAEIELGLKRPQSDELRVIASALGTQPDQLMLAL